jgi:hypothetical protein
MSARTFIAATLLAAAVAPAAAQASDSCRGISGGFRDTDETQTVSVSCKAEHPGVRYLMMSTNSWTIRVTRGAATVETVSSAEGGPPAAGALTNIPGDVVTITTTDGFSSYTLLDLQQ